MTALTNIRHELEQAWDSLGQGWWQFSGSAAQALTRFTPPKKPNKKGETPPAEVSGWGLLAGEIFEDEGKVVVRLEAPGLERDSFDLTVLDDLLIVRGEKRFQRESDEGGYHLMECAYGSFRRDIPLPAPVKPGKANARYRDGVLRVELPKAKNAFKRHIDIEVR